MPKCVVAHKSAPIKDKAVFSIRVEINVNEDAANIRKDIDNVNIIEVLLFLLRCPSMFFTMTV